MPQQADEPHLESLGLEGQHSVSTSDLNSHIIIGSIVNAVRDTCRIRSTSEPLGEVVRLTDELAIRRFIVHHERLPSGRRASSPHYHSLQEEFVFILQGNPKVSLDGVSRPLAPGDYVAFAPGVTQAHYLYNDGPEDAEYITIASPQEGDIITYNFEQQ